MSEARPDPQRLKAASEHVEAFGASEYQRGFEASLKLAELALRWMQTNRTIPKARMAEALAKEIRAACAEAGVGCPAEARESAGADLGGLGLRGEQPKDLAGLFRERERVSIPRRGSVEAPHTAPGVAGDRGNTSGHRDLAGRIRALSTRWFNVWASLGNLDHQTDAACIECLCFLRQAERHVRGCPDQRSAQEIVALLRECAASAYENTRPVFAKVADELEDVVREGAAMTWTLRPEPSSSAS